jgi:hypothetical protein
MSLFRLLRGFVLLAASAALGCAELDDAGAPAVERVGVARQPIEQLGDEVRVSIPGTPARGPSAAWIRSAGFSNGHMLIGYTEQQKGAAWAHSFDWMLSAPTYEAHRADEPAPFGWPEPDNLCDLYACELGETWAGYASVEQAVWTGLDDVAALVAIGEPTTSPASDLTVVTSIDGGQTFGHAKILSIPTPQGDSGGRIIPGSVHASLRYTRDRAGADAGKHALPIYVVWENELEGGAWWMAQFVVGLDGSVAQTMFPVKISVIPPLSAAHASILAHDDGANGEVIDLFWSLRTDDTGSPAFGPGCPSSETIHVQWLGSWTTDFGQSWHCTAPSPAGSCLGEATVIDEDPHWRPCVGASFSETPGAPPYGVNNDRPEIAMNENGDRVWYMAINKTENDGDPTRITLWASVFGTDWQVVYESEPTDPETGAEVGDAWGQSMAIQQGARLTWFPPEWISPVLALTWRTADRDGLISMNAATSSSWFGVPGTWHAGPLTSGQGVPWSMTDEMGLYTGTTVLELCVEEPCPGGAPAKLPRVPFLAAWTDNRSPGTFSEVWTNAFVPQEN